MSKFLYCSDCHEGIELKLKEIKKCKCKNVVGRYVDSQKAEICANNPKNAFFIGINCNTECILFKIFDDSPDLKHDTIDEIEYQIRSRGQEVSLDSFRRMIEYLQSKGKSDIGEFFRRYIAILPLCFPENLNSEELRSAVKETKEWKRYDKLKNEFLKIKSREAWEKWEKGRLVEICEKEEWDGLLWKEGYSIGTVISLKEDKWPEEWKKRWEYNQSICETG